jgi:leucyl-tRNA synthetase
MNEKQIQYNHKEIEKKWQKVWQEKQVYKTPNQKEGAENEYILVEFPYPSGNLHVGHWYAFAVTDIYAKYRKMLGKNVLFPIGFDAFGLPAENAAIKRNLNPREWTYSNIEYMITQLKSMGASFDWDRKIVTCDPEYYKWTQWLFIKLLENDLAYQSETNVNWCPSCKTVLANEQVSGGKCERCDSEVNQKKMKQWQFRITKYADKLVDDLDNLSWPHAIKEAQRNWIGRSEGSLISFKIHFERVDTGGEAVNGIDENFLTDQISFQVFTTRADTLFGVTYVVLAPESDLVQKLLNKVFNQKEVIEYIAQTSKKTEMDRISETKNKTGIRLEGVFAINPANNESVPIFISDYVLAGYGTGAVMAVPAHDERDFLFAKKFNLAIKQVITKENENFLELIKPFTEEGVLINSGKFDGLTSANASQKITEFVSGKITKNYRLRDWLISRQRYWGCPIPIIHCPKCGAIPVPENELPVKLPEISDYLPREDGKSPLAKASEWLNVKCPNCGESAERETDTLDTFIDSSWYYLRYLDSRNDNDFSNLENQQNWLPVDFYSGGSEHTTMHLLFARFFHKVLFDIGLTKNNEPFQNRLNRGLILGPDGNKMSKSKGNVVDPDEIVERLGADTVRGYLAFIGPYNEPGNYPWDSNGVVGIRRFIEKIYRLKISEKTSENVNRELAKTIKKINQDYQKLKFNTALAQLMIFINLAEKESLSKEDYKIFLKLIFPIFPHLAQELWSIHIDNNLIIEQKWPDEIKIDTENEIKKITVHINGKMRGILEIQGHEDESELLEKIKNSQNISKWLVNKTIKKTIYIKNKIFSLVVV